MFHEGWHIKPDLVLTIREVTVKGNSMDDYEYIYVPTHFTEDRWMQAAEVLPGDRRVVHHATGQCYQRRRCKTHEENQADAGVDKYHFRTGKVYHLKPDAPVYDDGCSSPDGEEIPVESSGDINIVPGIYLPGHLPEIRPAGYALRVPAGSYLQFQVHYSNHTGKDVNDRTSIGLVFAKGPVNHQIAQYEIWNNCF